MANGVRFAAKRKLNLTKGNRPGGCWHRFQQTSLKLVWVGNSRLFSKNDIIVCQTLPISINLLNTRSTASCTRRSGCFSK